MLNSNPSRSGGFTKGSRPFITPRSSKIAPMYLLHILPILAIQKLNYKYIRVCGIQIIHISGFFLRITHFFTPRGSKIAPMYLFHILPSLASQKFNYKYIRVCGIQIIHISGFFIRITHFFTPRDFRKSPRKFFLAIFRKFWLKIWLQVHYDMPN